MADDADMRNELSDMQQRADQLADEVSFTRNPGSRGFQRQSPQIHEQRQPLN